MSIATIQEGVRFRSLPAADANARAQELCVMVAAGAVSDSDARTELATMVHCLAISAPVAADYAKRSGLILSRTDQDDLACALDDLLHSKIVSGKPGGLDFLKLSEGSLTAWVNGMAKSACFTAARNNYRRTHGKLELVGSEGGSLFDEGLALSSHARSSVYGADAYLEDANFNDQLSQWESLTLGEQRSSRAKVLLASYGFPEPSRPLSSRHAELALQEAIRDPEAAKRSAGRHSQSPLAALWSNYDDEQRSQIASLTPKVAHTLALHALEMEPLPLARDYAIFTELLNLCDESAGWQVVAQELAATFAPWKFVRPSTKVADKEAFTQAHNDRAQRFEHAAHRAAHYMDAPLGETANEVAHGCLRLLKGINS